MSVTYSTNRMGPWTLDWYRERGLTEMVERTCEDKLSRAVLRTSKVIDRPDIEVGDTYLVEDVTRYYAGGRIDIRDDTKWGYDGWDEYSLPIMDGEDWNDLSEFLDGLTTLTVWRYEDLISYFEDEYGKKIRWANE